MRHQRKCTMTDFQLRPEPNLSPDLHDTTHAGVVQESFQVEHENWRKRFNNHLLAGVRYTPARPGWYGSAPATYDETIIWEWPEISTFNVGWECWCVLGCQAGVLSSLRRSLSPSVHAHATWSGICPQIFEKWGILQSVSMFHKISTIQQKDVPVWLTVLVTTVRLRFPTSSQPSSWIGASSSRSSMWTRGCTTLVGWGGERVLMTEISSSSSVSR